MDIYAKKDTKSLPSYLEYRIFLLLNTGYSPQNVMKSGDGFQSVGKRWGMRESSGVKTAESHYTCL